MGMGFAYVLPEEGAAELKKSSPAPVWWGEIVKEAGIRIKGLSIH